ncbi:MAG TPA: PD-(D/E)XK nuclease family protein, partial [Thermoanaerobaculia bacterium]|nr:PD-(D/E)XK nuclease family protein [Thermoanaerobaculia bacterium]
VLQRVLGDVPVKRSGFDEERYLFAQLLSASPAVTLSWQVADDDGKPVSPSPLVERLRGRIALGEAPPLYALPVSGPLPGPRPADEHAILAGLHAPRRWFGRVLSLALSEVRAGLPAGGPASPELAAARLAVLDELDPDLRTPEGRATRSRLGPYFGFVGRLDPESEQLDPRERPLYVTHLEDLAACPWQLFLRRLLRVAPTPDPLGALPGIDPPLLGSVVHAALERIAHGPLLRREPAHWPPAVRVDAILLEEAERLLAEEGIFLPGLARALADRARRFLDTARDTDWSVGALPVAATEKEGEAQILIGGLRTRTVLFKADRLDRDGDLLAWTDYKTGKPLSDARTEDARRKHFLDRVKEGRSLQAAAYVRGSDGEATGRYLYLRPELPAEAEREFAVTWRDGDVLEAFTAAVRALLANWDAGAFFPRVVDTTGRKEPPRCLFCTVAEACVRGDSGARHRLFAWTERAREEEELAAEEAALLKVWRLPAKEENGGEAG